MDDRTTQIPDLSDHLATQRGRVMAGAVAQVRVVVEKEADKAVYRELTFEGDHIVIGSFPSSEVALDDGQVSRLHCTLSYTGLAWRIVDNGSTNGTFLNGVRVRDADLPRQCTLRLGRSTLLFQGLGPSKVDELAGYTNLGELFGESTAMRRLFRLLERLVESDSTVLVEGESGTGKELVASELASRGSRAGKPFLVVDCGTLSANLIESELFGHERGAFTGADRMRQGVFEAAQGGTVVLDEIGELPLDMQPKLLRVLESRQIRRMGDTNFRPVDVRVIASTNRRLENEVNSGRFREDLYYRLSVVTVRLPALRQRLEDLPILVQALLTSLDAEESTYLFTPEALAAMGRYDWPGNVRELRNYVERTVLMGSVGEPGRTSIMPPTPSEHAPPSRASSIDLEVPFRSAKEAITTEFEKHYLGNLIDWADGNVSRAARRAKLDRMYLYRLLQKHGLKRTLK